MVIGDEYSPTTFHLTSAEATIMVAMMPAWSLLEALIGDKITSLGYFEGHVMG